MSDSEQALRKSLIRLAHANPDLRPHILPLLHVREGSAEATVRVDGGDTVVSYDSGKAAATEKEAHGPVALRDPEVMLYAIDQERNQSKFYEMSVVAAGQARGAQRQKDFRSPTVKAQGGGFVLQKRWGRLTDVGGVTGRVDSMDEFYDTEREARSAMHQHKADKERGSGSARYTDVSRSREYPIGLGAAGFGWGGQAACDFIPELQTLHREIDASLASVSRLRGYVATIARRNSSMGRKLNQMLEPLIGQMAAVDEYLEGQLAECRG